MSTDFYPRSPRGERPSWAAVTVWAWAISIHAPREGSDAFVISYGAVIVISIHAPREGSDAGRTPGCLCHQTYFYPRSPRGERQMHLSKRANGKKISIHAPREGSDPNRRNLRGAGSHFYPRSPRGERLPTMQALWRLPRNFYPRSPRGERPPLSKMPPRLSIFLSTLPARGATIDWPRRNRISRFLSTLPARGATPHSQSITATTPFLSTLPARGATDYIQPELVAQVDFYPRSPRGERRTQVERRLADLEISIHAPREGSDSCRR